MVKTHGKFKELKITSLQPLGWVRNYLKTQRDGLTGYIENAGYPFDKVTWAEQTSDNWAPYEQTAYWVDGAIRCGYLLKDKFLLTKTVRQIEYILKTADTDGYLGPRFLKQTSEINRWPHVVFFRAMMAYYSATEDKRILTALTRYYLSDLKAHCKERNVCNVEVMLWLYEKTGNRRILQCAVDSFEEYNRISEDKDTSVKTMLSDKTATEHGVTYNEIGKLGAIVYNYTGTDKYLRATVNAYRKLDRDQVLVDGVCSATEKLRGKDPLDSHETCDIADYTWSIGYLLLVTGKSEYADKLERACFNAAPGAVLPDFKGLQYFSSPNQVIATKTSNHNFYRKGDKWMSYRPKPGTECCTGDVHRTMPNFAARMWLSDKNYGLVAALYGACTVSYPVGKRGQVVVITEDTTYPFSDTIKFRINTKSAVTFPLTLRIPGWCKKAMLYINDKPIKKDLHSGTFVTLTRTFNNNDCITLILPMELKLSYWPRNGVAIERGPLVYSLAIQENVQVDETEESATKEFPAYNIYPASPWNYALNLDEKKLIQNVEIITRPYTNNPWSLDSSPVELRIPAYRVKGWNLEHRKRVVYDEWDGLHKWTGEFTFTPNLPDPEKLKLRVSKKSELIKLVPYGCTNLRLTIFPNLTTQNKIRPGE